MSTEQLENFEELGRRAVACPRWRWMPGMLAIMPARRTTTARVSDVGWCSDESDRPDLTDPATLGCLLALVREVWGDPSVGIFRSALGQEWCVLIQKGGLQGFHATTEAAALVAALEVAP